MSQGHGQLGLLDRLRDFDELLQDSGGDRRPYLELQLGVGVTGWTAVQGSRYKATVKSVDFVKMGVLRDVVGVETMIEPRPLVRVEVNTAAAGEFFADVDSWTMTGTDEASGAPTIYLTLPDSSDPNLTTVVALLLFTFGTKGKGEVHPWLGQNKLLNGGLESWSSPTSPASWTTELSARTSVDRESEIVRVGFLSARLTHAGSIDGDFVGLRQDVTCVIDKLYRLSGSYFIPAANPAGFNFKLVTAVGAVADTVSPTFGEWRRFLRDFRADAVTITIEAFLYNNTGATATGYLYLDDFSLQRIYRWCLYDPRIASGSIPALQIASQSILFKGKTIGIGGISLINGDGELAKALASLLTMNKPAQVWVGGAFGNGQEVYRDNWLAFFPGRTRQPDITDAEVKWDLDDARTLTKIDAPRDKYKLADFPNLYLSQEGYPRPYLFGQTRTALIKPTRIALSAGLDYGKYEVYDNSIQAGLSAGTLMVFPSEEMAARNLLGVAVGDSINDFTFSGSTISVLRDIRNYQYDRGGNDVGSKSSFDFDVGAGALVGALNISGPAYKVAADLQASMRTAIGDATAVVTYSESTHLFRVRRTAGTLNLLPKTGVNKQKQSWKILGFDTGSDKTGPNDYTGESATFTSPDTDHVLRVSGAGGYQDDGAGTILGAPSEDLDTPAAVASWLLQRVAKIPRAKVDVPGFKAAHVSQRGDSVRLRAFLDAPEDLSAILARLEQAGLMDLVVDGAGVWHCNRYFGTGNAGALELFDRDFLSWQMAYEPASIYKLVRVLYGYDPNLAKWAKASEQAFDPGIPVKHGSDEILEILSYFDDDGGPIAASAAALGKQISRLSAALPRIAVFTIAGRLPQKLPGNKVILTRTGPGVVDSTGKLSAVGFRILSLSHNPLSGISQGIAVEDVVFSGVEPMQVDIFLVGGTWTKNPLAKVVTAIVIPSGASGASGRKGAAGTVRCGGGPGGGGGKAWITLPASILGATETVTVGASVTGGAAQATNSTDGLDGMDGQASSFGSWLTVPGPTKGLKGTNATGTAGAGSSGIVDGGTGSSASVTGGAGPAPPAAVKGAGAGGPGGGVTSGNTAGNGGAGQNAGALKTPALAGGVAGTTPGGAGGVGTGAVTNESDGGAGGGGGAASTAGNAGAGGAGANYGGAGGGGGAAVDAVGSSGKGGDGAPGIVIVIQG